MKRQQLKSIVKKLETLQRVLDEKGIKLVIMIPPQKNTAFPEIGVNFPVKRSSPNNYENLMELIKQSQVRDNNIELLPLLREANKKAPVYHRTDFHWNDWGGAVAFGAAIDKFAEQKGSNIRFNQDLIFSDLPLENMGQALSVSTIIPIRETSVTVNCKAPITSSFIETTKPYSLHWHNSVKGKLGKTVVVIGDSYAGYGIHMYNNTSSGICDYFDDLYFIHRDDATGSVENLPQGTEVVILKFIEAQLTGLEGTLDLLMVSSSQ